MAKFELPIYGENDEVVKRYATNICPWGIYIQAADLSEKIEKKNPSEQMQAINGMIQCLFKGLTQEELTSADADDVMNTFKQMVNSGQQIKTGNSKNA